MAAQGSPAVLRWVSYCRQTSLQFLVLLQLENSLEITLHAAIYLFILQNCLAIAHKYVDKFQRWLIYSLPTPSTLISQSLCLGSSLRPLFPISASLQFCQWTTGCTLKPTFTIPAMSLVPGSCSALSEPRWLAWPAQSAKYLEASLSPRGDSS